MSEESCAIGPLAAGCVILPSLSCSSTVPPLCCAVQSQSGLKLIVMGTADTNRKLAKFMRRAGVGACTVGGCRWFVMPRFSWARA